jgi:hypothetical protein
MRDINNKLKSYAGFAIKCGKAVYGVDNILKYGAEFVLVDTELGQASKRKLYNYLRKNGIEHYETNLNKIINLDRCKAFGIKEKNLANAIKNIVKES